MFKKSLIFSLSAFLILMIFTSSVKHKTRNLEKKINLVNKEIPREDVKDYWGYKVKERGNLFSILSAWSGKIILTSK